MTNELIEEQALRDALRPLRPDPEAFRRAVERTLEGRRELGRSDALRLREAAAVLPLGATDPTGPLPALAVQHTGGLGPLSFLALPAASLAAIALTVVASVRRLVHVRPSPNADSRDADRALADWWREQGARPWFVLAFLVLVAWSQPIEAIVLVLVVSQLALGSVLVRLSRVGAVSRVIVGQATSGLLGTLVAACLAVASASPGVGDTSWRDPWVPFVLFAGWAACAAFASWRGAWSPVRKGLSVLVPITLVAVLGGRLAERLTSLDEERLRAFAERFEAPPSDVVDWQRFGSVVSWLRARGLHELDLERAERALRTALPHGANPLEAEAPTHSLLGAARAGFLADEHWDAVLADERMAILDADGPLLESGTTEWLLRAAARTPLSAGERDHLAGRLRAAWPSPERPRALVTMATLVEWLDLLARPLSGEPYRADAHAALIAAVHEEPSNGFVSDPADRTRTRADIHRVEPTRAALTLVERFGAPADLELGEIESFLRRAATPSVIEALAPASARMLTVQPYRLEAELGLRELLALRGPDENGVVRDGAFAVLLASRARLAAAALVLVCIAACLGTLRPRTREEPGIGLDGPRSRGR